MNEADQLIKQALDLAINHHQKGNFLNAEDLYNKILEVNPEHFQAIFLLGSLSAQINKYDKAIHLLQKAIQINPNHADSYFNLGNVFKDIGDHSNAANFFQKATQINPVYAAAYNNLGIVLNISGQRQQAIDCYKKAIEINPAYAGAYNNLGNLFNETCMYSEAIECYQKAINLDSNYIDAQKNLHLLSKKLNDNEKQIDIGSMQKISIKQAFELAVKCHEDQNFFKAQSIYIKILKEEPEHFKSIFMLGTLTAQLKKLDIAKQLFETAIEINPDFAEAHYNLGVILKESGDYKKSMNCYQKAIEIKPDYADAYNNIGVIYKESGNDQKAINCYQKAIEINPDYADAYNNLGIIFKESGEKQKAINCYQKAIDINPDYAAAYNNLGTMYYESQDFVNAFNCFQNALKINPKCDDFYYNLGNTLRELGHIDKAASYYNRAIDLNPDHSKAYNNLGLVLNDLRKQQESIICYQKALKIKPDYASAYNNLGNAFIQTGNKQEASMCFQKAIEYAPDNLFYVYQLINIQKNILDEKYIKNIQDIITRDNNENTIAYGNFILSKYEFESKKFDNEFDYLLKAHEHYYKSNLKNFTESVEFWLEELPEIREIKYNNIFTFDNHTKDNKDNIETIKPIFVIGIPRCGSTLLEKIIASNSKKIQIGEETEILLNFVKQEQILKQRNIHSSTYEFRKKIIDEYEKKGILLKEKDLIFTDKSLENFYFIGFIKEIFPEAKIINCKRDALSSIMSILKNNLIDLSWAHDLDNIFEYIDVYYNMLEYYKNIFPDFIYEIEYETLVANPESEIKKLLKFCDLPWDKRCLEFYNRKDIVSKTSSNIQIRKPINLDSVNKYQVYKKYLKKYIDKYWWFK